MTTAAVVADWDDVDAAAVVAASKTESVVLGALELAPGLRQIDLLSIRDEPIRLEARRGEAVSGGVRIELSCLVGRLGDSEFQGRFLDAMAERLGDLRGVDYRKVR